MVFMKQIYNGLSTLIIILYVLAFLGLYQSKKNLDNLSFYFRLFIGLMLVYIFNPYIKTTKHIESIHRNMAFSGGVAILTTIGLTDIKSHTPYF